ncbi:hypothetical protein CR513_12427, partial [Mucuna pruriens]
MSPPGVACNASYHKGRIGILLAILFELVSFAPCINRRNSERLRVLGIRNFPAFHYLHFLAFISYTHGGARLGTEKPKVTGGNRLDYQCTLVDLVLSVPTSRGGSSPSTMVIVVEDGVTESRPCIARLCSICLHLAETKPDYLCRDPLGPFSAESDSASAEAKPGQMENHDRTLKELATPDVVYQPWCIQYPQLEPAQTYELKSGLIHLLLKFHGLPGEDPYKHLKEFHVVCSTMRPQGILEDYIKMKAFPFSLDGAAKDWLYLQPALFNTWGDMKRTFLEKFFPASKTATIRKEICGIRQHTGETLHEYWECFNKLCATCPHHQISEQLLIQYFYEGLVMMDKSMTDAASGGALMDKTPVAARHLISNMVSHTQQFGIRGPNMSRSVNEIGSASNQRLENQLTELTSMVRQLAVSQHHPAMAAKVCGICTSMEHPTDLCPTLQETESGQTESVGAVGGFQYGKQPYQTQQFDNQPYGKQPFRLGPQTICNSESRSHAKCTLWSSWLPYQASSFPLQQQRTPTQGNSPSLEDLMKQLATSNMEFQQSVSSSNLQFQQNMTATIHDLKMQIGQLADTVSELQSAGSSNLPSQPVPNPRGNANIVTLESGKELPQPIQHQVLQPAEAESEAVANS